MSSVLAVPRWPSVASPQPFHVELITPAYYPCMNRRCNTSRVVREIDEYPGSTAVGRPIKPVETLQESDYLEKHSPNFAYLLEGTGTQHVRLASLGCMCGTKLSFQQLGRGAETLPFDWVRSRLEGILHFMRSDFQGFFDFDTIVHNCGGHMTMYRSENHSFWHDDPTDESMQERYTRRFARFNTMRATKESPLLFVRAIASTDELQLVPQLLDELEQRFGACVCLLVIIDYQKRMYGPAVVKGSESRLLFYFHSEFEREPAFAPYIKPVQVGLLWAAGQHINPQMLLNMEEVALVSDTTNWGYMAHGNVASFSNPTPWRPPEEVPWEWSHLFCQCSV